MWSGWVSSVGRHTYFFDSKTYHYTKNLINKLVVTTPGLCYIASIDEKKSKVAKEDKN